MLNFLGNSIQNSQQPVQQQFQSRACCARAMLQALLISDVNHVQVVCLEAFLLCHPANVVKRWFIKFLTGAAVRKTQRFLTRGLNRVLLNDLLRLRPTICAHHTLARPLPELNRKITRREFAAGYSDVRLHCCFVSHRSCSSSTYTFRYSVSSSCTNTART